MKASNLNPILEQLSFKIPLEVDLENITVWLNSLNPELVCQSCGKVLRLLKSLPAQKLEADVEFQMLSKVRSALEPIALKLEKTLLDAGNPFSEIEQINAEMIIFSYAELAQRFLDVAETMRKLQTHGMQMQAIANALFEGLEASRRALLYISLLYDQPYEGFWHLCYRIYRRAESLNILDVHVGCGSFAHDSISNSFISLLAFYLSDTHLLTQREMKALNNIFNHRPVPAKIFDEVPQNKADLLFGFALQYDLPPVRVRLMGERQGELRYISTIKVARLFCQYLKGKNDKQNGLESGNYSLFMKVAKVLGMQTSRQYSRVTEKRHCPVLIGVNKVLRYLMQQNTSALAAARQILPTHLSNTDARRWAIPEFNLVPEGEEEYYQVLGNEKKAAIAKEKLKKLFDVSAGTPASDTKIAGWNDADDAGLLENIEILDSSAKDYGILLKSPKNPVKIGDLIGILSVRDNRIELGLVRRLNSTGKNASEAGVELITLQAGIGCVWRPGEMSEAQIVMLLPGIEALQQKNSIIYPSHAFAIGETIVLLQADNYVVCRLEKLLHITSVFSQAELSVLNTRSAKDEVAVKQ